MADNPSTLSPEVEEHSQYICRKSCNQDTMEAFRLQNLFCDFVLRAGKNINCHKLILAARVPYFKTMLTSDFLEAKTGEVEFPEHMAESLDIVIKYIYTGAIKITVSNVWVVLRIGSYLGLDDLVDDCNKFIIKNFDLVSGTDELLSLEWITLLSIIESDELRVNEQCIWEAVMKWVKHDSDNS